MEEDTTQQDADSHSGESPESSSSGTPAVDPVEEAVEVHPEQVDVNPEILKELRAVMSRSYKYPVDDEGLKECINEASIDPKKLLQFFKDVEARYENTDQGEGNLPPSDHQMEEDTTQQDADSHSVESPESRYSGTPAVDPVVEEEKEVKPPGVKSFTPSSQTVKSSTASSQPSRILAVCRVKVHSVTTGRTCGADDEILEKVMNMRWPTKVKITTDYQECDIIIVFCPIKTREGSDVPAAMRKIPAGDKPVILVLMHHTRDDDFSTDIKKWSGTCQNVVLDVHVLFHETQPGLLKSPRNDEAVHQIQEVLKALSKSRFGWPSSGFNALTWSNKQQNSCY
ncbi:uncharacterized protein LOC115587643 [Sparus aurata]|uniref:uncharacterized protein LOC115587643 n=1 Tax=Sparus aurata TaxID=8175 RepID=UPI0011C1AE1C|nr:uncharacterized protein LOC115587643 [Sparus aurata]